MLQRLFIVILALLPTWCWSQDFQQLWYDGKAEISVYRLEEKRYGQVRHGHRVMVFVTEPMRLATHIKPDEPLADHKKVNVLKLNDLRHFPTGIYKYDVMTSVFSAVEGKPTIKKGSTMKVSFTSQEWCGTVFDQIVRETDHYQGYLNSYFESEGVQNYQVPHHHKVETEENLWILIRELQEEFVAMGESKQLQVLPSAWHRRKKHQAPEIKTVTITKQPGGKLRTPLGLVESCLFTWEIGSRKTSVWVEKQYPHRILRWEEPGESKGFLIRSSRETYWQQNSKKYSYLREQFLLD